MTCDPRLQVRGAVRRFQKALLSERNQRPGRLRQARAAYRELDAILISWLLSARRGLHNKFEPSGAMGGIMCDVVTT